MRKTLFSSFCIFVLLITSSVFLSPRPAHALGISPPTIIVDGLLRDTTQTRSITLFRAPNDVGNVNISVVPADGNEDYFVLDETELVMVEGQSQVTYEFGVTPADAPNGDYEWKLRFLKTADAMNDNGGSAVSVVTGVGAQILVTVGGEEQIGYSIDNLSASATEEGLDAQLSYIVSNTGNVDWRPSEITFTFFNEAGESTGTYTIADEDVETSRAGQDRQEFSVSAPVELVRGSYTVSATFTYAEEEIAVLETGQPFKVYAPGTLAQSGELKGLSVNKESYVPGEKVKLSGIFTNDGDVEMEALLVAEISRDGQILDLIRGNERTIAPEEEIMFTELLDADIEGAYTVSAYVEYGSRQTGSIGTSFSVQDAGSVEIVGDGAMSFLNSFVGLIILAVLVIGGVILLIVFKRRRKKNQSSGDDPSTMTGPTKTGTHPTESSVNVKAPPTVDSHPTSTTEGEFIDTDRE